MAAYSEAYPFPSAVWLDFGQAAGELWTSFLHLMSRPADEANSSSAAREQEEIRACQGGDHDAYEILVRRYQQQIGNLLWRFTHDPGEHEDLVHLAFVEAWVSIAKFRGDGTFAAWLSTIATRVGYAFWKKKAKDRKRNEVSMDGVAEPSQEANSTLENEFEPLEQALAQLSPRDRLVLTLLYLEEHTVAETSELTGWSQSMVKVQAHRARGRLKKLLDANDERS